MGASTPSGSFPWTRGEQAERELVCATTAWLPGGNQGPWQEEGTMGVYTLDEMPLGERGTFLQREGSMGSG